MSGERDLETLFRGMQPLLHPQGYVFCSVPEESFFSLHLHPLATFRESEGVTVVLPQEQADENGLEYDGCWALITLSVHSSLDAVGFLAEIATALARAGISVNVFSAYFHDHLLVPWESRNQAMRVLAGLRPRA